MYKIKRHFHLIFLLIFAIIFAGCSLSNEHAVKTPSQQKSHERPVLLSNRIHCISASAEDVWIATDRGVNRYANEEWSEYTIEDGLADNDVKTVAVDGDFVWFGTSSGLSRYNKTTHHWQTFTRDQGVASNIITALAADGNYLWVGTPRGLSRYNKDLDVWALHTKEDGGLNSDKINAIAVEDDYVWIATDKGVSRYDKNKDAWNKYTKENGLAEDDVRCIATGKDFVWFGTYNSGVSEFSKVDGTFVRTYTRSGLLFSDKIKSILVDSLYLWIGTANAGMQRYITSVDTWMQYTVDDGLAGNHVTSIDSQKRYVWFGTSEDGISRFDTISGSFTNFSKAERLVSNNVKEIVSDGDSLWTCTPMGLGKFSPNSGVWERFTKADGLVTNYITCVAVDGKDIWIGTSKGVGYYNNELGRWNFWSVRHGLPDNFVFSLSIRPSPVGQQIWVGTRSGLTVYNQAKDKWQEIEAFAGTAITAIAFGTQTSSEVEASGTKTAELPGLAVWIGTNNGLFSFRIGESRKLSNLTVQPAIIEEYVNKIVVSDEEIYACTQNGLAVIDEQTGALNKRYTKDNGLPSNNVRDVIEVDAEVESSLWLATPKGLCYLNQSGNFDVYNLKNSGAKMGHENVRAICVLDNKQSKDTFWLATEGGVSKLSINQDSSGIISDLHWKIFKAQDREDVLRHSYIPQILRDEQQIWSYSWHGTSNGEIIKYDQRTDTWTLYTKEDISSYKSKTVNGESGKQVKGQSGKGVNGQSGKEVKGPEGTKHVTRNTHHTPRIMFVRWADAGKDSVWFATNAGVLRYRKSSDTWRHYTVSDGLASNRTTWLKADGDYIWVRLSIPRICWYNKKTDEWYTKTIAPREGWQGPTKIAVDARYVWIPNGWDGILRYDKKNDDWKKYTERDGLAESSVENVTVSRRYRASARGAGRHWRHAPSGNYVWVEGGAVNRYDYDTDTWITIDGTKGLARTGGIRDIFDGRDYLWILYGSWRRGSDRMDRVPVAANGYHKKNGTWRIFRGNPETVGNDFVSVREADDVVWFASDDHGLSRYDKASSSWTVYTKDDGLLSDDINENTLQVDEKYVWAGTQEGVSRYDTLTGAWTSYTGRETLTDNRILTLAADGRYIWCGTEDGLSRYDKQYNEWTNFHARRFEWWRMRDSFEFEELEGLSDNNITSITVDPKYVWVGTQDGMNRYDKSANRWDTYDDDNGLPDDVVRAVVVGENNVWVGTPEGVAKYARLSDAPNAWESFNKTIAVEADLVSKEFAQSLSSNDIRCLYLDDRYLWVGTKEGVSRYDTSREIWEDIKPQKGKESKPSDTLTRASVLEQCLLNTSAIAVDGDSVWFGSDRGVICWNQEADTWKRYTSSDGLASENVTSMAVTENSIWFGTFDSGVSRYLKDSGKWQTFTKKDGLSHNSVFSITIDDKFVWFGTELGLSRYDTVTDTWTVFTANFEEESY